jgi:hypothetical protein
MQVNAGDEPMMFHDSGREWCIPPRSVLLVGVDQSFRYEALPRPASPDRMGAMILRTTELGPPDGYDEIADGMSNFDHTVDDGVEDRLRTERVWCRYAGWNFNGRVWLNAEGSFSCQVWVYGSPVATVQADTLDDLMREVSDEWGWE